MLCRADTGTHTSAPALASSLVYEGGRAWPAAFTTLSALAAELRWSSAPEETSGLNGRRGPPHHTGACVDGFCVIGLGVWPARGL